MGGPTVAEPTVAVSCMLLAMLLAVTPTRVTEVVVVMVMVVYPFTNVAAPVPLVTDMLKVIGVVLVDGLTVAVVGTGFPSGTKGVSPNVTPRLTLTPPLGLKDCRGQVGGRLTPCSVPVVLELVEAKETP